MPKMLMSELSKPARPLSAIQRFFSKHRLLLLSATLGSGLLVGGGWLLWNAAHSHPALTAPKLVYTANGFGGFVPAPRPAGPFSTGQNARPLPVPDRRPHAALDPVQPLRDAYNAGRYPIVEAAAPGLVFQAKMSRSVAVQEQAAQARSLLAYSAARRHDLTLARKRFAIAENEAAKLPDRGKQAALPGRPAPTLEEDAAYEHAVCTNALGDPRAAQAEYIAFMKRFPKSPLVSASIKRIAWMHGGDAPPAAQAAWQDAEQTALARQKARFREASLCGPECLAELLRRLGESADVHALADQMHTSDQGTTLLALAAAVRRHGYAAQGLALTQAGLAAQSLPVIALVSPGHFVLVDGVTPSQVSLWDPDAHGLGHGAACTVPTALWQQEWG